MVRLLLTSALAEAATMAASFNPTMVRLLQVAGGGTGGGAPVFQSHNGAIAANELVGRAQREGGFNPTMVRLLQVRSVPA